MTAMTATAELVAGTTFARRYRLDARLGRGGMGEVWRGLDLQLGRQVAIKVLLPQVVAMTDGLARFEREARVGAALGHPNVVHTLDFGHDGDRWFLIMQLVIGEDLYQHRVARHPLAATTLIALGYQIADALAAAHAIGLVHRDLKPENVLVEMIGGEPLLRVADFGMAYVLAPADPRQGRLTADGMTGGTPLYMAPEQAAGLNAGPPADVYALGCVLFELATGVPPYDGGGVGKVLAAHLYAPIPSLRARRPDLPTALDELVQRMLAKAPAERPSADAVRRRLAVLDGGELDPRARARDGGVVSDRAARMVSERDEVVPAAIAPLLTRVGVIGVIAHDVEIALAAAGMIVADAATDVDARIVVGASLEAIAHACLAGAPVVADAPPDDFRRISALLRLGVAEVVLTPIVPAGLVRKLARAIRKHSERPT